VTHIDKRGDLTELWSLSWNDRNIAKQVKHVYYNTTHKGVIKGWHVHEHTFSQYTCVAGKMQVILVDLRSDSKTYGIIDQFIIGEDNPSYIKIPPGVLKAWKSLKGDSVIVNLLTSDDVKDNFKYDPGIILQKLWK
ncbi:MAG: dTDP-4-dehydrorhamnose 3,5-epimerase family protein, partial [Methanosarcinaceae archaeon]|nr:dTDP-4-dehydrorhamnose 3,5-epimerase family protein [Methanosarcinaceae archaeon]